MIEAFRRPSTKRKGCIDTDKMAALDAWRRVDCRTRQALRRNFLSDLVEGYEVHILLLHKCDVQYFLHVISCIIYYLDLCGIMTFVFLYLMYCKLK